ncbi:phospholipase A [Ferrimonas pelagia]|uniref:Phospholipase A1 n=1 Tax=Ferrimonas pelagia TaxID=1177826 RepID=A0ABP9EX46_9GAMM
MSLSAAVILLLASSYNADCLQRLLDQADPALTLEQLRSRCQQTPSQAEAAPDPLDQRLQSEQRAADRRFALNAHHNNYLLPFSYNHAPNRTQWEYSPGEMDSWEMQFQLSFKVPITPAWFSQQGRLFVAYTNQSWWQAYNKTVSAPFRETNHMPELIYLHQPANWQWANWDIQALSLSFNHQSNGRSGLQSRSWNRIIAGMAIANGPWIIGLNSWYRLKEDPKETPDDPRGDDNPDILDYMGHGELMLLHKQQDRVLSLRTRGNIATGKGGIEAGWSFPLRGKLRGYVQAYYGYGESLIDYNAKAERISLGIEFTPWL